MLRLDAGGGEFLDDVAGIGQGAGEPIELGYDQGVAAERQAASAWRSPGRARLVPVRPWST